MMTELSDDVPTPATKAKANIEAKEALPAWHLPELLPAEWASCLCDDAAGESHTALSHGLPQQPLEGSLTVHYLLTQRRLQRLAIAQSNKASILVNPSKREPEADEHGETPRWRPIPLPCLPSAKLSAADLVALPAGQAVTRDVAGVAVALADDACAAPTHHFALFLTINPSV